MALILTGEWLGVERRAGEKDGKAWAFTQCSVLDGMDVRRLMIPDEYLQGGHLFPAARQQVQLRFNVRAFNRANGAAEVGWELLEWLDDPTGPNGDSKKG